MDAKPGLVGKLWVNGTKELNNKAFKIGQSGIVQWIQGTSLSYLLSNYANPYDICPLQMV